MFRSDPPRSNGGGPVEGCKSICMEGGVSHSGLVVVIPFRELVSKPLTRVANRKLDWVLGASTDVRAWIMSCLVPVNVSQSSPNPLLMELELVTKVT